MTDQIESELIQKLEAHLPDGSDPTVLVLKAHLLVEEELVLLLQAIAPQPEHIARAKLTFPQRVEVLQAFIPIALPEQWFKSALLLNAIRNRLAHQLSPKDLQSLERDFTLMVFNASRGIAELAILPGESHQEKFKTALAMLVISLSAARSALPVVLEARKGRSNAA